MQLGILGVGNMGGAILNGILSKGIVKAEQVRIFDLNTQKVDELSKKLGVSPAATFPDLAAASDIILLAVKPNVIESVIAEHYTSFVKKAVVSIIAGWNQKRLAEHLPESTRILRVMPNMPAMTGAGMTVLEKGDTLTQDEHAFAKSMFEAIGRVDCVDAKLMDAVTAVSGSGPAYVCLFMEAMADGGVQAGLPRDVAYTLTAQTLIGTAEMMLNSGTHPGELKDRVCSPAGTTIDAVAALEKDGFRYAVMDAVKVCYEKSKQMGK
jgi:pyrroline-5-carboxylate reductase